VTGSTAPAPAGDTGAASNGSGAPRSARNSSAGSRPLPNGSGWNGVPSSARPACGIPLLGRTCDHCSAAEAGSYPLGAASPPGGRMGSPSGRTPWSPAAETGLGA
jgi:hypothetical protein